MEMLRAGEVREDNDCYQSPLDELFERLEMRNPDHIAVKYYKDYHSGSAKTLKSNSDHACRKAGKVQSFFSCGVDCDGRAEPDKYGREKSGPICIDSG